MLVCFGFKYREDAGIAADDLKEEEPKVAKRKRVLKRQEQLWKQASKAAVEGMEREDPELW